jgi:hypothetical protein
MDYVKSFFVGLGAIIAGLWVIFSLIWLIGLLFSFGQLWFDTWLWLDIVALVPYGALVVAVIAVVGEDIRNG